MKNPCRLPALVSLCLVVCMTVARADDRHGTMAVSEGTRFVVAFPQVWVSAAEEPLPNPMILFISSPMKAVVRVRTSAKNNDLGAKIDKTYTVNPNRVISVPIPRSLMMPSADTNEAATSCVIRGVGIEITSTAPISVSTYQAWTGNGELTHHLPVAAWGTKYSAMCFYNDAFGKTTVQHRPGQIIVIAQHDSTLVNFTPTWDVEGGPDCPSVKAGRTGTVELNNGEVFLIKGRIDPSLARNAATDLSGSVITSSKPIAVISGHTKVAIMRYPDVVPPKEFTPPSATSSASFLRNNVYDALLPLELAGTEFVTIPSMYTPRRTVDSVADLGVAYGIDDNRGDVIRFNAIEDGTELSYVSEYGDSVPVRTLHANESYIVPTQIDAALWRTSKPATCALYGKSWANIVIPTSIQQDGGGKQGEEGQEYPNLEHGKAMMEIVPSVDRWATRGLFVAPEGMDNFLNITFQTGDERFIILDADRLSSVGKNDIKVLSRTPYSYVRMPIGAGEHIIRSTSDTVRWCAWNYGSLDGMQMGRAYGTPVAIATNVPCDDSVVITDVASLCGSFTGTASIPASSGACGALAMIYADSTSNCTVTIEPALASGATTGTFVFKPVDPTRDATCVLRAVTRSGNYVERTYRYAGQQLIEAPSTLDFGVISPTTSVCRDITINNPSSTTSLTVHQLHTKANTAGLTFPTGPFVLAPAEARTISLCLLLDKGQKYVDTLVAEVDCGTIVLTAITGRANYIVDVHDDATITTPQILSVVPNPARDLITFHLSTSDAATIELVDITGAVVAQISTEPMHPTAILDVHSVAAGTYTAVLRCRAGVSTMNVVVLP